jgi:hypothetical protein
MTAEAIRPDVVDRLVNAACTGMSSVAHGTSASEVFSAALTLASRTVGVALELGVDPEVLRGAIVKLWEQLPPQVVS